MRTRNGYSSGEARSWLVLAVALMCALGAAGCGRKPAREPVRISVVMKKYSITPNPIRVKEDDEVELKVSTVDVQHGFNVPDLGIKEPVQPGKPATIRFTARKRGEYVILCSIICGPGHDEMSGAIVVE